jgi:hypothetical protein
MIPKTVHQIWLGNHPFPAIAEPWRAKIKQHLPEWEYRLWADADLPALAANCLCPTLMLDERLGMGIRPDVIRFEILRPHGGLYLDHDMELLAPLDEIMVSDCMHFGFDSPDPRAPGTAILASPAGHPFWEMHLRRIRASVNAERPDNPWGVLGLTGPHALDRSIAAWLHGNCHGHPIEGENGFVGGWIFEHGDLVGWSREAVYPYHFTDMSPKDFRQGDFPNAYAAHHWQGEWFREDKEHKAGKD